VKNKRLPLQRVLRHLRVERATGSVSGMPRPVRVDGGRGSWYLIRPLQRADEAAIRELFTNGMMETIVPGLRRTLCKLPCHHDVGIAFAGSLAIALAARVPVDALGVLLLVIVWLAMVGLPHYHARAYIAASMREDLADIAAHYTHTPGNAFFVAVDVATGELVGTVGAERERGHSYDGIGNRWTEGDCQLRRLAIDRRARGTGLAAELVEMVRKFAAEQRCNRVVTSSSCLQVQALKLFSRIGFEIVHRSTLFRGIDAVYMALPVVGG
jgi:GNAT superfamily N-acetyltransferase